MKKQEMKHMSMNMNMSMSHALADEELDTVSGGAVGKTSKYALGQVVRVRDGSVSGGSWTGEVWEMPEYKHYNNTTTWYYNLYNADMPLPYGPGPTIVTNVPERCITGLA